LILGKDQLGSYEEYTPLLISHHPIQTYYKNVKDYVDIVMPLLEEEWHYNSSQFKNLNLTVRDVRFIKLIIEEDQKVVFAIGVLVPRS